MDVRILCDANWDAGVDKASDRVWPLSMLKLVESYNYGTGLLGIIVGLMCRDPHLNFKQRIRLSKKDRILYMDVMLDYPAMREADDDTRVKIVRDKLKAEVPRILAKYKIPDFDNERFLSDFATWLATVE